jgi:hypothetical protein
MQPSDDYYLSGEWQRIRAGGVLELVQRGFAAIGHEFIKIHHHLAELDERNERIEQLLVEVLETRKRRRNVAEKPPQ